VRGYVAQRRNRFYAVIYEGIDPITGRERRRWRPAGTDREQAKELATALAAAQSQRIDGRRVGPTFGVYLTMKWLPAKQLTLRPSTGMATGALLNSTCSPIWAVCHFDTCEPNTSIASTPRCLSEAGVMAAAASTSRPCTKSIS
jgi:hypothetical protein